MEDTEAYRIANEAMSLAKKAYDKADAAENTALKAETVALKVDAQMSSLVEKLNRQDGKIDTMLDGLSDVKVSISENSSIAKSVKLTVKFFTILISLGSLIVSGIKLYVEYFG